jgi:phage shock protein PspC (stress-responsive transcriptional regulator)
MKKTVSINISGIIFHIDDDAFERLSRYLNSIKRHFAKMEGKEEIITDIESRIAEVLQEKLQDNKQVISIEDIEEVISIMGEPSEMDEDNDYEEPRPYKPYTYSRGKRLYRDPDGRMIAGVASGLAAYFNIDPVWVRIIFIVSLFIGFAGFIAYVVLWIVVPEAITTAEKLEMRGEPVNISNIERSVRDEFDNVKGKFNEFAGEARETFKKKSTGSSRFFDNLIDFIGTVLRIFFKIIAIILGIAFIFAGLGFILTFTAGFAGFSSFSFFENGELINFQLMQFLDMIFTSPLISSMSIIAAILLLGIPLIMLIYFGFRLLLGKRVRIPYFSITALAFWVLGLILAVTIGVNTGMDFRHSAGEISPPVEIQMSEKQILYFDVQDDKHTDGRTGTFEVFDGEYSAMIDDDGVSIFDIPYVEFRKSATDAASVNMTAYAKGSSRDKARQRARALEYSISNTDTSFSLSTYYYFPRDAVIRAQEVQLEIEIPEGQIVHFDKNMEGFFDDNPNWRVHNKGYEGKTWIMTRNGLKPYVEGMEIEKPEEVEDTGSVNEVPRHLSMIRFALIGM